MPNGPSRRAGSRRLSPSPRSRGRSGTDGVSTDTLGAGMTMRTATTHSGLASVTFSNVTRMRPRPNRLPLRCVTPVPARQRESTAPPAGSRARIAGRRRGGPAAAGFTVSSRVARQSFTAGRYCQTSMSTRSPPDRSEHVSTLWERAAIHSSLTKHSHLVHRRT